MNERDYRIARQLKKRLSDVVELVDFRVFGSRVREEQEEYSDMDVFIEVEFLSKEIKEKIYDITWEIGFRNFMVISPIIFTYEEIEDSPLRSSPIVRNIQEGGIRV